MKNIIVLLAVICVACASSYAADLTPMNGNWMKAQSSAKTVADSDVLAYDNPLMILTSAGLANTYTNTITIANPTEIGLMLTIYVAPASSNLVGIADSGNCNLSAAFNGDDDDTLSLIATATNEWSEVSRSSN